MFKKFAIFIILFLTSCGSNKIESPVIYFSNSSYEPISNIKCHWADNKILNLQFLDPGESRSNSFYIDDIEDFFGRIKISWYNDQGKYLVREFNFRHNHLPSIKDKKTYNYVQIYLEQDELEIVSSDAPNLSGKINKMDKLLIKYKAKHLKETTEPNKSLISIETELKNQRHNPMPAWLLNSY